jgi:hypothetical protein
MSGYTSVFPAGYGWEAMDVFKKMNRLGLVPEGRRRFQLERRVLREIRSSGVIDFTAALALGRKLGLDEGLSLTIIERMRNAGRIEWSFMLADGRMLTDAESKELFTAVARGEKPAAATVYYKAPTEERCDYGTSDSNH